LGEIEILIKQQATESLLDGCKSELYSFVKGRPVVYVRQQITMIFVKTKFSHVSGQF